MKLFSHKSSYQAFTLLELLIVMTIIVIIMAVGAPVFFTLSSSTALDTEVRNITATLSLARQWAITRKEKVTFSWTPTNYTIFGERTGNILSTNISSDLEINANGTFTFNPKGEGIGNAIPEKIEISQKKGTNPKKKIITIYKLTGGIKVDDI